MDDRNLGKIACELFHRYMNPRIVNPGDSYNAHWEAVGEAILNTSVKRSKSINWGEIAWEAYEASSWGTPVVKNGWKNLPTSVVLPWEYVGVQLACIVKSGISKV